MEIDHINIKAPQELLDAVRHFYCTVLGLQDGFRPKFSHRGHWLYAGDRPIVHLSLDGERRAAPGPAHLDHVAFRTEGVNAFRARLDANAIAYRCRYIPEIDLSQLSFRDPAGTGLEVNFPGERVS